MDSWGSWYHKAINRKRRLCHEDPRGDPHTPSSPGSDPGGVFASAVNKWENALNYPDITLLPTLARTLGVDLNTLLSFREDMTCMASEERDLDQVQALADQKLQFLRDSPGYTKLIRKYKKQ